MESKNPTSHNYKNHKNDSGPGFPSEQGPNVIPPSPVHPPLNIFIVFHYVVQTAGMRAVGSQLKCLLQTNLSSCQDN